MGGQPKLFFEPHSGKQTKLVILGHFMWKTKEIHSKYQKTTEFQSKIELRKYFSGPQVGHPWSMALGF
jgi:hypothetical protein